jgi:hypothetical protein
MNEAIVQRNRRAVYHALSSVLRESAAITRALDMWETNFSDQRGFRVNLYVNAVTQVVDLNDAQVRALASGLYAAMTTPEKNLPQLPAALRARNATEHVAQLQAGATSSHLASQTTAQPAVKAAPPVQAADVSMQTGVTNPRLAVFTSLLAALIDGATRARKFDDFLESMDAQAPSLSPATLQARTVWINSALTKLRQFVNVVSDAERRAVVNDLYVALCDACGPVAADRILAAAVQATEQTPEAGFSSPRSFL